MWCSASCFYIIVPFLIHSKLTKLHAEFQKFLGGLHPEPPQSGGAIPTPEPTPTEDLRCCAPPVSTAILSHFWLSEISHISDNVRTYCCAGELQLLWRTLTVHSRKVVLTAEVGPVWLLSPSSEPVPSRCHCAPSTPHCGLHRTSRQVLPQSDSHRRNTPSRSSVSRKHSCSDHTRTASFRATQSPNCLNSLV